MLPLPASWFPVRTGGTYAFAGEHAAFASTRQGVIADDQDHRRRMARRICALQEKG
jgi:hypothetical protein